jgi:Thioredoxin-like
VQPSSGLTRVLIFAAAVIAVLATLRIQTKISPGTKRESIRPPSANVAKPEPPPLTGEQQALLARILTVWKKRQQAAATFSFVWDSKVSPQLERDASVAVPQSGLWDDGDSRFRQDSIDVEYADDEHWRQIAGVRLVHDGNLNSRLMVPQAGAPHVSLDPAWITLWRGNVRNRVSQQPFSSLYFNGQWRCFPVLFAVRPMNAAAELSSGKCEIASEDAVTGGAPCVVIRAKNYGNQPETFWIDPKRDDVVVRWERGTLSVAIDYQHDPKHGWVPAHWSWTLHELNPDLTSSGKALGPSNPRKGQSLLFDGTVRSYSIGEAIPAAVFAQTYPDKTLVFDVRAGSDEDWKRQQAAVKELDDEESRRWKQRTNITVSPPPRAVSKEERATLEAIATAWAKRRAKIQSFEVAGQRQRRLMWNGWMRGPVASTFTACTQGDRFALEFVGPGLIPRYPGSKQLLGTSAYWKTAFDGVETRGVKDRKGPAWVRTGPGFDGDDGGDCVWLAVCPWDARLTRLDPARLQVVAWDAKIEGTNCVIVRQEWSRYYWLDPARDFIVLRKQVVESGADQSRVDFSYRQDANFGWAPAGWREIRVGWNYEPAMSLDDTVQKVTFNGPIPSAAFAIDFPEGAYVEDLDPEPLREERAREQAAATIAARWAKPLEAKSSPRPHYDPKFDARVDLEQACKAARESKRRVLIEFGSRDSPDCRKLYDALARNAEIAAILKKSFVLILVDTDYHDAGQIVLMQYVPDSKQDRLPLLAVMASDETVLDTSDTSALKAGDNYAADRLRAYLKKLAAKK